MADSAPALFFVSYARVDQDIAERLVADLGARGVSCWIDQQDVQPGTPDWEQALRNAIRATHGTIIISSPAIPASRYVKDELRIAQTYGRPVYPIWVAGDTWMESIPIGWGGTQYIDARGGRYDAAVATLVRLAQATDRREDHSAQPRTVAPPVPEHPPRNPYKGLRPFRHEDTGDFFGRERVIGDLLAELETGQPPRYLAVIGPSGSGKSSVVLAGVLPKMRGGALPGSAGWTYLEPMAPGAHPLEALTIALANALPGSSLSATRTDLVASSRGLHLVASRLARHLEARVVLVVDQFEELFTLTTDDAERQQFIELLATAVSEPRGPVVVLLTLRADFYDRPMSYPDLVALMDRHTKLLPPMELADLRAAIEQPAALPDVGLVFEGDLVGDLLFDVRGQAGALPLLQFTLDQLFERREGRCLTLKAYQEIGGVRGALSRHAEATYVTLPSDEHRCLARALFLRLIDPGATEQEPMRRRAALTELTLPDPAQSEAMRVAADRFVMARLLSAGQNAGVRTIEVSHEALIREWPRLATWLREAREDIRLQQSISADAAEWDKRGHPVDSLYRGIVLTEAQAWAERNTVSSLESAFLDAAMAEAARQETAERARQARELILARRAATRLRTLVGVLAVFLLLAAGLTSVALSNAHQAQLARQQAITARDVALSRQVAAQAVTRLGGQYDLALLLSLEARRAANTVEARDSLLRSLQATPLGLIGFLPGHALSVTRVAISPNGAILAAASVDGTIGLWDLRHRRALGSLLKGPAKAVAVVSVAFSPDSTVLASGDYGGTVRLWDVARRRPLGPPLRGHTGSVTSVVFSPDGQTLAAGGLDNTIRLWDVARRRSLPISPLHGDRGAGTGGASGIGASGIVGLAYSPNGMVLASSSVNGTIQLWHATTGAPFAPGRGQTGTLTGHSNDVPGLAFSSDGSTLASAGFDRTVRLWDVARQRPRGAPLIGHTHFVWSVSFSPDGQTLASGSADGSVRLWDVRRQRPLGSPLVSHSGEVTSVAFSPDGRLLVNGTSDGSVALWDMRQLHLRPTTLASGLSPVLSVAVSPDGTMLASGGVGATLMWDLTRRRLRRALPVGQGQDVVAFSPDGRMLAMATSGPRVTLQLGDVASGRPLGQPVSRQKIAITKLAFSPDGKTLASASLDHTVQLWSVARQPRGALRPLGAPLTGHTDDVLGLAFSPDGTMLASSGSDQTIRLWDVVHRRALSPPLRGYSGQIRSVAFSPKGHLLAAASDDDTVQLWDVTRRRAVGPPLIGHTESVVDVAFSPDGTMLASSSWDYTVRLWDVASAQPLGTPLNGYATAFSLAFSPDGTKLVAGGLDGTIRLWDVDLRAWSRRICRIANRNLTWQEWHQYLGDLPYHATCPGLPAGS